MQLQDSSPVLYLTLINRAGGLYGRILTEVVSTDRTQWAWYMAIHGKQEQFNSFNV